jgi:hypothetical protein
MLSEKHSPIVFNPEPTPAFIVVKEPKDLKRAQKVNSYLCFLCFHLCRNLTPLASRVLV